MLHLYTMLSGSGYSLLLAFIQSEENKLVFINLGFWWAASVQLLVYISTEFVGF